MFSVLLCVVSVAILDKIRQLRESQEKLQRVEEKDKSGVKMESVGTALVTPTNGTTNETTNATSETTTNAATPTHTILPSPLKRAHSIIEIDCDMEDTENNTPAKELITPQHAIPTQSRTYAPPPLPPRPSQPITRHVSTFAVTHPTVAISALTTASSLSSTSTSTCTGAASSSVPIRAIALIATPARVLTATHDSSFLRTRVSRREPLRDVTYYKQLQHGE